MKRKFLIGFLLLFLTFNTNADALPTNSNGDTKLWDGIRFDELINNGIYYGTLNHATDINYGVSNTNSVENAIPRETNRTPILWTGMGDEGDGKLTVFSKYVIDARKYNHKAWSSQATANFAVSRTWVWLNVQTNSSYGGITDGFLNSFMNDDKTEYEGLTIGKFTVKLFDRYTAKEYTRATYLPLDWSGDGAYYQPNFPYIQNTLAYLPWGHAGGYNPGVSFLVKGYYPHDDSGKLYWNSTSIPNDTQMVGSAKNKDLITTLKNGKEANYWTGSGNAIDNGVLNAYGDGETYGWPEDTHSSYPFYVETGPDAQGGEGTVISYYEAQAVNGVRPIVKIDPEKVLMAHEVVATTPSNAGQLQIADKTDSSAEWNYEQGTTTKNYKLTMLSNDIKLNQLSQDTTNLTSGVSTLNANVGDTINFNSSDYSGQYLVYKVVVLNDDGTRSIVSYGTNKGSDDLSKILVPLKNNMSDNSNLVFGKDYTVYVYSQKEGVEKTHSFDGSPVWHFKLAVTKATLIPPVVTEVDPKGTGIAITKDKLTVNFSKEMDKTKGVLTLDNGAILTNGVWSTDGKSITYDLSGLDYSTKYTYTFTGFVDLEQNALTIPDPSYNFTTVAKTIILPDDPKPKPEPKPKPKPNPKPKPKPELNDGYLPGTGYNSIIAVISFLGLFGINLLYKKIKI